jgi:hypothetical protein
MYIYNRISSISSGGTKGGTSLGEKEGPSTFTQLNVDDFAG